MSRDPLSDVVRALDLSGALFLDARFTAPWSITARIAPEDCRPYMDVPAQIIAYHLVTHGKLLVAIDGEPARESTAGEVLLLPRNDTHVLTSSLGVPPLSGDDLELPESEDGIARIEIGGGGEETRILCGFLASNCRSGPLLDSLPALLTMPILNIALLEWVEASIRIAADELGQGRIASQAIMSRLVELLFVEALRHHVETAEHPQGWLSAMRDPKIGKAIALMHGDLSGSWSVDHLACALGMSRSTFVARFTDVAGMAPMRYLTQARLAAAQALLRETDLSINEIAYQVGYSAPVAFNRAFKKEMGLPPAAWRDTQAAGGQEHG